MISNSKGVYPSDIYEVIENDGPPYEDDNRVTAVTSHGSYTFNIIKVEYKDDGKLYLTLKEREKDDLSST